MIFDNSTPRALQGLRHMLPHDPVDRLPLRLSHNVGETRRMMLCRLSFVLYSRKRSVGVYDAG